ncbi:TasA family protein [Thermococcus sp. 21S9]|uniref:TasA family protein n=1 Tax=Thermococcus sp. 21S9 TaxID=1638223 RepID=UPI001F0D5DC6|nr:TasA family protein [Thermococcus sp. 21S9]
MKTVKVKLQIIVVVVVLMVAISGVAKSYFTDTAVSKSNRVTTAEFDIAISKDGKRFYNELKLFELSNMLPGENRNVTFLVKNRGTVTMNRLTLTLNVRNYEVKMSPAEKAVDSTPERGELGKWLVLKTISVNGRTVPVNKTLDDLNGKMVSLPVKLKPGEKAEVRMTFELPAKAGNECQTDGIDVTLRLDASQ